MRKRDALKLHDDDEVLIKSTGEVGIVMGEPKAFGTFVQVEVLINSCLVVVYHDDIK